MVPVRCRVNPPHATSLHVVLPCQPLASAPTTIPLASSTPDAGILIVSPTHQVHPASVLSFTGCPSAWNTLPLDILLTHSYLFQICAQMSLAQGRLSWLPSPYSPLSTLKNLTRTSAVMTSGSPPFPLPPFLTSDLLKALLKLGKRCHLQVSVPMPPSARPSHTLGTLQANPGWGTSSWNSVPIHNSNYHISSLWSIPF